MSERLGAPAGECWENRQRSPGRDVTVSASREMASGSSDAEVVADTQ